LRIGSLLLELKECSCFIAVTLGVAAGEVHVRVAIEELIDKICICRKLNVHQRESANDLESVDDSPELIQSEGADKNEEDELTLQN
jgi:hypothetical protein